MKKKSRPYVLQLMVAGISAHISCCSLYARHGSIKRRRQQRCTRRQTQILKQNEKWKENGSENQHTLVYWPIVTHFVRKRRAARYAAVESKYLTPFGYWFVLVVFLFSIESTKDERANASICLAHVIAVCNTPWLDQRLEMCRLGADDKNNNKIEFLWKSYGFATHTNSCGSMATAVHAHDITDEQMEERKRERERGNLIVRVDSMKIVNKRGRISHSWRWQIYSFICTREMHKLRTILVRCLILIVRTHAEHLPFISTMVTQFHGICFAIALAS